MITLNPIANVHHYDQHLIFINIDNQPELTHCLNNPFALSEDPKTFQFRQIDPVAAAQSYRMHLWELIQRKGETYKQLVKLAKASKAGKWVELSFAVEQKHAEVLAKCLAWLEAEVTPEEPVKIAPKCAPASALESMIGFLDFDDFDHRDEELEQMYMPIAKSVLRAEDHDVPLTMISWITGKRLSVLAYMQDDYTAILPSGAMVDLKEYKTRFAKHKIGSMAHVQRSLAKAYNDYYAGDEADWEYNAELMPSGYNYKPTTKYKPNLQSTTSQLLFPEEELENFVPSAVDYFNQAPPISRYESDFDPDNENNYDHDGEIDYIALAIYDTATDDPELRAKAFNRAIKDIGNMHKSDLEPETQNMLDQRAAAMINAVEEPATMTEVYTRTAANQPLKVRKITDQAKGSPRRTYATKAQAQEYRRRFA